MFLCAFQKFSIIRKEGKNCNSANGEHFREVQRQDYKNIPVVLEKEQQI